VSHVVQDLADAFFALARSAVGSPSLVVLDGKVPTGTVAPYALVYFYIETPDGLEAPDAVSLTMDSDVIDAWAYVHCVGADPEAQRAARAVSGRVRGALLNKRLTVADRDCAPIRHDSGQPARRDEDLGPAVMDLVDVYKFRSVPA
jgi:hypothetical protein